MYDTIIRGGLVIDGTGAPGREADVAIHGDRIVKVGRIGEGARRIIDAKGKFISPGLIENHTHYDAQILWDSALTPSPEHGFTTVIAGNCGLTMAPVPRGSEEWLYDLMVSVESIPRAAIDAGIELTWDSFGEYLDKVDKPLGANVAFLVGHSALRRRVMGPAASTSKATPDQIEQMRKLLADGLAAGGFGFSSGMGRAHFDGDGVPTPPRHAAADELVALAGVLRDYPGTVIQVSPGSAGMGVEADDRKMMIDMSIAADRPVFYLVLQVKDSNRTIHERMLALCDEAKEKGALLYVLGTPNSESPIRLDFYQTFLFPSFSPTWQQVAALPVAQRIEKYKNPEIRRVLDSDLRDHPERNAHYFAQAWQYMVVNDVPRPDMEHLVGRTVGEIARERGVSAFDAILDISIEGGLHVGFIQTPRPTEWERKTLYQVLRDPRMSWGGADAGAHLDLFSAADAGVRTIQELVIKQRAFSLEEVIHRYSYEVARKWGLRDRGVLREGAYADVVVFDDLEKLSISLMRIVHDLPGGAMRLRTTSTGINRVLCNGREVFAEGAYTGELGGRLLRSGRDTVTRAPRLQ